MTDAITAPQLATLRSPGQWSKLFIAGSEMPRTIFNARVNQTFAAPTDTVKPYDKIAQVTYDLDGITPVGVYGDALPGMTCFVGTTGTGTGLHDVGIVRIRKAATSSVLYFGEESDIEWADNLILTVIDSMEIWPKHFRVASSVSYVDYDVPYSDQHTVFAPVPIMGGDAVVELDLTELVTNGTFTTTTDNWTAGTGVLLTVVANAMKVDRNGAATIDHAYQDVITVVGKKYKVVVNVVSYSHQYEVYVGGTLLFDYTQGTGTKTYYFTATATTTRIAFRATNDSAATLNVDDVSFQRVETVPFDATDSWVFGSTISTYAWTTTAGTLSSSSAANPTLTIIAYPTGGKIRVALTVTSAAGKTATGYRYIHVYNSDNPPQSAFRLNSCYGSVDDGGFVFDVTMYASAGLTTIRDRAPMILFAQDHYGTAIADQVSLGQLAGRENIVAMGWIDGESIEWNADRSTVTFTVQGPQFWMRKMTGFPANIKITKAGAATNWNRIPSLTVDRAIWSLLHWHSTATAVLDFYPTGDTRLADKFEIPPQSLWDQITAIATPSIFARPCCDPYNRLFVEVDINLIPEADRTTIPVVMEITKADRKNLIRAPRKKTDEVSVVDLSGNVVQSSGNSTSLFALANGHVYKRYGVSEIVDMLLLSSQTQANQLAGLLIGKRNNPFPEWNIDLAQNNRMIGICPHQCVSITVAAGDTVRGFTYSGNLIPRSISYEYNEDTGFMSSSLSCEAETFEQIAITGDAPSDSSIPPDDGGTDPPTDPPPVEDGEVPLDGPANVIIATSNFGLLYTINAQEASPEWFFMNSGLTATESQNVKRIIWCPSGALFIMVESTGGSEGYGDRIYWAPGLGGAWALLVDDTFFGGTTPHINAIGYNPLVSEQFAAFGGAEGQKKFALGDRNGLVIGATGIDGSRFQGTITFEDNLWRISHTEDNIFDSGAFTTIDASGASVVTAVHNVGNNAVSQFHLPLLDYLWIWSGQANNDFWISKDDGSSDTSYLTTFPENFQSYRNMAISPDRTRLMGSGGTVIPQRSSDGGVTFGNVGTGGAGGMTVGFHAFANGGDGNWWFSATTQKVIRTSDFGDNWEDRTGNLSTLAPLCAIIQMQVMG